MRILGLLTLGLYLLAGTAMAADPIGQIKTAKGEAFVVRGEERLAAELGAPVFQADEIETGANGSIGITFVDNSVFSTGPNTRLSLEAFSFDSARLEGNFTSHLRRGTLSVVSGDITRASPDAMQIRTPTSVLGVRGTTFVVHVSE